MQPIRLSQLRADRTHSQFRLRVPPLSPRTSFVLITEKVVNEMGENKIQLSKSQEAVVNHRNGRLVVIAGPGTGKSITIVSAINKLLSEGIKSDEICYLTFMKTITNEFRSDLDKNLSINFPKNKIPKVSTAHSFAWGLYKEYEHIEKNNVFKEVLILDNFKERKDYSFCTSILNDVTKDLQKQGVAITLAKVWKVLKYWRKLEQNNYCVSQIPPVINPEIVISCLKKHFDQLQLVHFDLFIPLACEVMRIYKPKWLERIKYYFIDEFQDFNYSETEFLNLLEKDAISMVYVGDDDQSIFSDRSANPKILKDYLNTQKSESVYFEICHRCPKRIVNAANSFLKKIHKSNSSDREMKCKDGAISGDIKIVQCFSTIDECRYIAQIIKQKWLPELKLAQNEKEKNQIIGLFYNREKMFKYMQELLRNGIQCVLNHQKDSSVTFDMECLLLLIYYKGHPLYDRYLLHKYDNLSKNYHNLFWNKACEGYSILEIIKELVKNKKLNDMLESEACDFLEEYHILTSGNAKLVCTKYTSLKIEAITSLLNCSSRSEAEEMISNIINDSSKNVELESNVNDDIQIQLLTMNSCKGLTKRFVFIPGFRDDWIPGYNKPEIKEELQRKVYVAITRASEEALFTYPNVDDLNIRKGNWGTCSRFSSLFDLNYEILE